MSRLPFRRALAPALMAAAASLAACDSERSLALDPDETTEYSVQMSLAARGVPGGTALWARATTDSSVTLRLRNLDSLTTGVYQVWLGTTNDTTATDFVKATGRLLVIHTDTTDGVVTPDTTTVTGVSSFSNGGKRTRIDLRVDRASLGSTPLAYNLVLVTIEGDANATTPSTTQPFWARRTAGTTTGTTTTTTVRFGNFAPRPADEYLWLPTGRGRVAYFGSVLTVDDSSLTRPPRGYYYATHLLRQNTDGDSVGVVFLGAQTAPFPRRDVSLRNADVEAVDEVVLTSPPAIVAAASRLDADTVAVLGGDLPFSGVGFVYVTLEAKAGGDAIMSPTVVLESAVMDAVRTPPADD